MHAKMRLARAQARMAARGIPVQTFDATTPGPTNGADADDADDGSDDDDDFGGGLYS